MIAASLIVLTLMVPRGCDLLWGNAPMNLYGSVVDQMGNPVPDARIVFDGTAQARFQAPMLAGVGKEVTWRVEATSGKDGQFAIHDGWGTRLQLAAIQRPGYERASLYETFHFGRSWLRGTPMYHPDRSNPVTFLCWNHAFRQIISKTVETKIGSDPYGLSYRSGRISNYGTGDENIHFRVIRPAGNPAKPFDWSLEVQSVYPRTAEVMASDGPLGPQAPARGYQHVVVFDMKASDPAWATEMTRQFYTCSDKRVYAGVGITARLDENGSGATVIIHYAANFVGSRDLVPGPATQPSPN